MVLADVGVNRFNKGVDLGNVASAWECSMFFLEDETSFFLGRVSQ